jgi:hypothetical protein
MLRMCRRFATFMLIIAASAGGANAFAVEFPNKLRCVAVQTAGFHDYPHNEESYEAVVFFESEFELKVNKVLMQHLSEDTGVDLYLTFKNDEETVELTCRRIRGAGDTYGLSCANSPPAEMLLINADTLRFTRTSIGGWAFAGATANTAGDSIFVEYGECVPR